ncbi:Gfo/Idh/MocA family oxidoreductase [Saccharothrix violaceirubra]|uniref:Putative dehydrogenase n=1 Tax=Saccharothrix violaceirubra TaxID=413306 RepID=A0A7W7T2T3_9PSEU|nr:Gfo/Idh/MocA family oxidoreductase [Saccharothrix violaceirubra]MBB4965466.1 putative dehydrogenase [Saccharothrix violaceirubra]
MTERIRVGIVGANPDRSWAARAHVPALRALPEYELTAVGTSRQESADAAAHAFGARHAFADARALAESPDVDLVVVAVKVPAHRELVGIALDAGKHVHVEWPLARTTAEAEELAKAAADTGVHTSIGLQARFSPEIAHARTLIADGVLGTVTAATVYSSRFRGTTNAIPSFAAYVLDRENGAGTLEVAGGHTIDALEFLLGGVSTLSAHLATRRTEYVDAESGAPFTATAPDNVLLNATLATGVVASVHISDGRVTNAHTRFEISGTAGSLTIESHGPAGVGGVQLADLRLVGSEGGTPVVLRVEPDGLDLSNPAGNVARLYRALAADLRTGSRTTPDFAEGLRVHRLLDAVRASAADSPTAV